MICVNCKREIYGAGDLFITDATDVKLGRVCENCLKTDTEDVTKLKLIIERSGTVGPAYKLTQYQSLEVCPRASSTESA